MARILGKCVQLDDNGHGHLNLGEARCEDEWFDVTMVHAWVGGKDNGATDALNHLPDSGCNIKVEHSEVVSGQVDMNITTWLLIKSWFN